MPDWISWVRPQQAFNIHRENIVIHCHKQYMHNDLCGEVVETIEEARQLNFLVDTCRVLSQHIKYVCRTSGKD
jgi:hypothetical protein